MLDPTHPLAQLLNRDRRYRLDAYAFVEEALGYAHEALGMGRHKLSDEEDQPPIPTPEEGGQAERHLTGQELCEAIRQYAVEEFGYLAKSVLNSWGIYTTRDFGNIVFNLIEIKRMKKTREDRLEDFDDVYDFDTAFRKSFHFRPDSSEEENG
ncbi:MAG TPA: Minf_1886 family protein [Pirellulales bacterium]|nr:Minf_1886 family protein [Pirellulales bacterium]